MGTRKRNEMNVRNITQNSSGTYSVSLPLKLVRALGWRQGQKVYVEQKGSGFVITELKEK